MFRLDDDGRARELGAAAPVRRSVRRIALAAACTAVACDTAPCDDRCGLGTRCLEGKCVVDDAPPEDATTGSGASPTAERGRRKGKRRRGATNEAADGRATAPVYDDSSIPRYDPERVQSIGEGSGSERLPDRTVRQHLDRIEPGINACIRELVEAGVEIGSGQVSFQIGIEPSGKVWGITASAPSALKASGVVACMRTKIHAHRFPAWDGPAMGVDYSFEVR